MGSHRKNNGGPPNYLVGGGTPPKPHPKLGFKKKSARGPLPRGETGRDFFFLPPQNPTPQTERFFVYYKFSKKFQKKNFFFVFFWKKFSLLGFFFFGNFFFGGKFSYKIGWGLGQIFNWFK